MRSKIPSVKMDSLDVNKKIIDFLEYMEDRDEPEIASEFLISQLSYIVSTLSRAKQKEFVAGLNNAKYEVE